MDAKASTRRSKKRKKAMGDIRPGKLVADVTGRLLSAAPDEMDSAVEEALGTVCERLGMGGAGIIRLVEDGRYFTMTHFHRRSSEFADGVFMGQLGRVADFPWLAGLIAKEGPAVVSELSELPAEGYREMKRAEKLGIRSGILIPLLSGKSPIGILLLISERSGIDIPGESREILQILGCIFGFVLSSLSERPEPAAKPDAGEGKKERVDEILRIQTGLLLDSVENIGLEEILERALSGAIRVSEMDCGGIYLLDGYGGLELKVHRGQSERLLQHVLYYDSRSRYVRLVREGRPVYIKRSELAETLTGALLEEGVLSVAVLPIGFGGDLIASLNVGSRKLEEVPGYARRALEAIAAHVGTAIHHAMVEKKRIEQEKRLRSLFKAAPIGIGTVMNRILTEVNERAARIVGYSRVELVGKNTRLLYPDQKEYERAAREAYTTMRERGVGSVETRFVRKDGRLIDVLINLAPLDPDNPDGEILFTLLDITDRKGAERELAARLEFEEFLSRLAARFVNIAPEDLDVELMSALERVAGMIGADRCAIMQVSPDGKGMVPTHIYVSPDVQPHQNVYPLSDAGAIVRRWKRGEIVAGTWKSDFPSDLAPAGDLFARSGWKCSATIPLSSGENFVGALGLSSLEREELWPKEVLERLRIAGNMIANAIARIQAERSLRKAFTEIKQLRDQLQSENIYLKAKLEEEIEAWEIVGKSEAMKEVIARAEQVAKTDATVLLLGETGTGKGMVARLIHDLSPRASRTMVEVNCATLQEALAESELFGHEKGAFTGAHSRHKGRFEVANGSTIFLDEVGELSLEMQAKLLRVLQDGEFERVGGTTTIKVDVRVIAASNRDLAREVVMGNFREDLYYRLNVFPIYIPPLRDRKEDIPLLVWKYVHEFGEAMGKRVDSIPHRTMERLVGYPWPGNVRELRNVIERAMILSDGKNLPVEIPAPEKKIGPGQATLEEMEKRFITEALERTGWRIRGRGGAAELLGLKPTTLYSKMKKFQIERPNSVDI